MGWVCRDQEPISEEIWHPLILPTFPGPIP